VLASVITTGANASATTEILAYTPAGVVDTHFGENGIAALPVVVGPPAMAIQPNGQIVVAGGAAGTNVLATERLNANGTVDTTFGTNGVASTNLNCCSNQTAVAVSPGSGDIVACAQLASTGRRQPPHTALARFLANGALDATFGSGGIVNVVGVEGCSAVALLSTGEILVENGASAQFEPNGTQEATVTGGTVVATGGTENPDGTEGSIFLPNGDYLNAHEVFVGEESRGHNGGAQVVRFTANGTQDSTFNNAVFHFSGFGGSGIEAAPNGIAAQSNGDIVVVGLQTTESQSGATTVNGLARLTSTGALDTTFGNGGVVSNTVPAGTEGYDGVAIDSEGRIIVVGIANNSTSIILSRYLGH
jgi:uncharacterized delta-60 repeat protein